MHCLLKVINQLLFLSPLPDLVFLLLPFHVFPPSPCLPFCPLAGPLAVPVVRSRVPWGGAAPRAGSSQHGALAPRDPLATGGTGPDNPGHL